MMVHTCSINTQETETGELPQVPGQPEVHLSQRTASEDKSIHGLTQSKQY